MKKRIGKYLIAAIVVSLGYTSWSLYEDNKQLKNNLGQEKQMDFFNLEHHTAALRTALQTAAVTTDPDTLRKAALDITTYSMHISQIHDKIFEYEVYSVYNHIHLLGRNLAEKPSNQPLTEQERNQLRTAEEYNRRINDLLEQTRDYLISHKSDFIEYQSLPEVQAILQQSKQIVAEHPLTVDLNRNQGWMEHNKIPGESITVEQAIEAVKKFVGTELAEKYDWAQTGGGRDAYGNERFEIAPLKKNTKQVTEDFRIQVSSKGGHIIRYIKEPSDQTQSNQYGPAVLSLEDAEKAARTYLSRWNPDVKLSVREFVKKGSVVHISFAPLHDGIPVEFEGIQTTVSLDKGELITFDPGSFYLYYKPDRSIAKPGLTVQEAKQKLAPGLSVEEKGLAYISNRDGFEALTYRFTTKQEPIVDIYVNAFTGAEERIRFPLY